jgi:transposase
MSGVARVPRGPSKFSPATRERAVRLVLDSSDRFGNELACVRHVCSQFGMHEGTLRRWVREARAEAGEVEPLMDWKDLKIAELERDKAELEQTVEVLKAATSFFAREYDPRPRSSASS